jgi:post-segregation antitoxin (ccd killing protein)
MNVIREPRLDGPTVQTSVILPEALIEQARSLAIDISQAAAAGLAREISCHRAAQWAHENSGAVEDWARYLQDNGQPFEDIQSRIL